MKSQCQDIGKVFLDYRTPSLSNSSHLFVFFSTTRVVGRLSPTVNSMSRDGSALATITSESHLLQFDNCSLTPSSFFLFPLPFPGPLRRYLHSKANRQSTFWPKGLEQLKLEPCASVTHAKPFSTQLRPHLSLYSSSSSFPFSFLLFRMH